MGCAPAVSTDGLGADYARSLTRSRAVIGVAGALAITALATGWWVGPFAVAALISAVLVAAVARRAFGGVSGDTVALSVCCQAGVCRRLSKNNHGRITMVLGAR